jgi:threonine aldolase
VGSVLCGPRDFVQRARHFRKMVGGGMRQAGVLAAAGLVALEQMVDRLADDHRVARVLAEQLAAVPDLEIDRARVQTNMVRVILPRHDARAVAARLRTRGVRASVPGPRRLRFVVHRHITDGDIPVVVDAMRSVLQENFS